MLSRPTNVVVGLYLVFYGVGSFKALGVRLKYFITNWKLLLLMAVIGLIVFVPQFIYWHLTTGHWIVYSYKFSVGRVETFIYWENPKIFKVLFRHLMV